jgi:hypothetical protein
LEYCPAQAIKEESDIVFISEDLCFECGLCRRIHLCPTEAFIESDDVEKYPRVVRAFFSDPNTTHELTLVPGRGAEESKTNDVTGRIKRGQVGICIEFGRPGTGSNFRDISLMTAKLKKLGVEFEPNNPLTALMDIATGEFPDELIDQRILSAIIEIKVDTLQDLETVIPAIIEVSWEIDTVFSLGLVARFENNSELPILEKLSDLGLSYAPNAKINFGLGRPLVEL